MFNKLTQQILILVFTVFVAFKPSEVKAQWNTNTFVNLEISSLITADMISVPTSDGKTWIAYYHENSGNYDMRAQLIDENGYKQLGNDGILVSNQPSGSSTYVFNACVDGANNLIIGCQDLRNGTLQAVLYKISPAGAQLWGANGVVLGAGLVPNPAALSNNDIAVTWNDDASGSLKLQKITAAGSIAWSNPVTLMVGSSTTTRGQIVGNLNEKFTVVYQKNAGGISTNLYAQMFNSSGTALYSPLQICNQTTAPYRYYSIVADADTTYFGYYSSTGMRFNSFVQRINPAGTIPWGMNGSAFNTYTSSTDNYQMETSIGLQPGSPYIWSVCSFTNPNQTNYGVYVQKFLKTTGARQFTDMGKVVYAVSPSRDTKAGEIAVVDDNPMFASYDSDYKIYATRLDANGDFAWPGNRVELSSTTSTSGKGRFGFTKISLDRCAGIWTEDRGSGDHGYIQGISVNGVVGVDVATQGGVPATITISGGTLQLVATVFPSTASQSVNWSIIPVTGYATINTSGLVTGVVDGTVWAKATSVQDNTMSDSIQITLSNQIPIPPTVVTLPATSIDLETATLNGSVTANNYNTAVTFEWGLTAAYGSTVAANPGQVTGNVAAPVSANLTGLVSGTTYHFRCVGVNTGGTTDGEDLTFTTLCLLPGTMSAISGTSTLCAGTTGVTYTVDPFPGATTYIWTLPPGVTVVSGNSTNSITVDFSPTALSGDISVYATDGTCISLPSPVLAITVIPLPVQAGPVSGIQVVCEGDLGVNYSITPLPSITSYVWTVPTGAAIASGQNTNAITVDYLPGSVSGNITVQASNSCGAGPVSAPLPISVNPLPGTPGIITGPDHICKEASGIQYSIDPVSNAYGYNWTLPAGVEIIAGANTNQITVAFDVTAASGDITVVPTNGNCIGEASPALYVTVDAIPPTPVITQHGDTLTSSADAGNLWYLEGVLIPGATGKEYVAVYAGNYSVIVTLNGCSSSPSNGILVLPVSIPETASGIMNIYPIPAHGDCFISLATGTATTVDIELFNSQGMLLRQSREKVGTTDYLIRLNTEDLSSGAYLLIVRGDGINISRKILILH